MKTKTLSVALYKCVPGGYDIVLAGVGDTAESCIRVSELQDVEFQILDDSSSIDAVKDLKVKAIKDRIDAAQKELDALL